MSDLPDLVLDTELETSFDGRNTVHYHDDYTENGRITRPSAGSNTWEQIRMLGHGGYGHVYLQRCIKGSHIGRERAVKVVHMGDRQEDYYREIEAIAKFSQRRFSKYFVLFHGWYESESRLFIAMEYFPHGDLQRYMEECGVLSESDAKAIGFQVLVALKWMHRDRFSHRDIKPSNILIKAQPSIKSGWWVKLSDFGISKRLGNTTSMTSIKGTVPFMAPELIELLQDDNGSHHSVDHIAADMWSLGEVLFRMLTGSAVFRNVRERYRYLEQPQLFPSDRIAICGASGQAPSLISALMKPLPESRLSSDRALAHEWFQSLNDPESARTSHINLDLQYEPQAYSSDSTETLELAETHQTDPWATVPGEPTISAQCRVESVKTPATASSRGPGIQHRTSEEASVTERLDPPAIIVTTEKVTQVSDNSRGSPATARDDPPFPSGSFSRKAQLIGHKVTIVSIIISRDGSLVASKSEDDTIKVWNVGTMECRHTFDGNGPVLEGNFAAAFSPDGRQLVSAIARSLIHVWDMETGKCFNKFDEVYHEQKLSATRSVAVSADGCFLASVGDYWGVYIWSMETGAFLDCIPGSFTHISVTYAGDLVTQDGNGRLDSWNLKSLQRLWTVETGNAQDCLAAISTNGYLASGYGNKAIKILDVESGRCLQTLIGHASTIKSIVLSKDNRLLATRSNYGTIKIWDPETGQDLQTLNGPRSVTHLVTFSDDGRLIVLTSFDNIVEIWEGVP